MEHGVQLMPFVSAFYGSPTLPLFCGKTNFGAVCALAKGANKTTQLSQCYAVLDCIQRWFDRNTTFRE